MAVDAVGGGANSLYQEIAWKFKHLSDEEDTRNGPVRTMPYPFGVLMRDPRRRLLREVPHRHPNHVFHIMEAIWMLAGCNDVSWLLQFNKGIGKYAEEGIMHGAYGHRWRKAFGIDQIREVIERLKSNWRDRQAVIGMWDPCLDLRRSTHKDRPCNTHIYFRVLHGCVLNMHVCNRSNDFIWGMMGSNIVHMTMLQELIAWGAEKEIGEYRVTTNNLHYYTELPHAEEIVAEAQSLIPESWPMAPLLQGEETYKDFLRDCEEFVHGGVVFRCEWFYRVARGLQVWYVNPELRYHIEQSHVQDPAIVEVLREFRHAD